MDILLLILLAVGFIFGLISGAVKQLISFVAFVVGFVVACLYYQPLGEMLSRFLSMETISKVVAFVLIWVAIPIVANLIASMVTSMLNCLPALGTINRLLGGILGIAKYALVLGAFIWLFSSANLIKEETMQKSKLCRPLKAVPEYIYNTLKNYSQKGSQETTTCRWIVSDVMLDS